MTKKHQIATKACIGHSEMPKYYGYKDFGSIIIERILNSKSGINYYIEWQSHKNQIGGK